MLHFEDFPAGRRFDFEPVEVRTEDILAFAREFDAQPVHLSESAGRESILGGLAASGWHTSAIMMRMLCDTYIRDTASEGSPGIDSMEWKKPVLAGDMLSGRSTVVAGRVSKSRPEIGIVAFRAQVFNQRGDIVAVCDYANMVRCRPAGDPA